MRRSSVRSRDKAVSIKVSRFQHLPELVALASQLATQHYPEIKCIHPGKIEKGRHIFIAKFEIRPAQKTVQYQDVYGKTIKSIVEREQRSGCQVCLCFPHFSEKGELEEGQIALYRDTCDYVGIDGLKGFNRRRLFKILRKDPDIGPWFRDMLPAQMSAKAYKQVGYESTIWPNDQLDRSLYDCMKLSISPRAKHSIVLTISEDARRVMVWRCQHEISSFTDNHYDGMSPETFEFFDSEDEFRDEQ